MFLANWWKIFAKSSIHNAGKKLAVEEDEQVFFCCVILAILMISSSPLMAKDALHNEIIQFDIPRQQADMSLIKFAEQADLTLIVPFDQVRKITTNRLVCRYPIKEALEILLSGTGLTANVGDSIRITFERDQEPEDKMNTKKSFLAAMMGVLFGGSGAHEVLATPPSDSGHRLEEIIVTTQKRSESVQDVSIAISAFSESELKSLGVTNLEDLTEYVSGTELFDDRGAGQPTWIIRGVGLADFNSNNTPTAAIYYDEYYLSSNVLGGIGMFDIGRVEVLKGPQSGLYGRNTTGGAVRVMSSKPSVGEEFNGYISGNYGRWDRAGLEAAVGGSLGDSMAFRIAAQTDQGGGWQDSLATQGDDEHGDRDFTALRAQLLFQPSDTFDMLLKIEGGEDKSETTLSFSRALYDAETGGICAQAYAGKHDENNCVTISNLTNLANTGDLGILPGAQKEDGTKVLSNPVNELDNSWLGLNLQMNWDLGFATLTSISGYLDFDHNQNYDYDAQPLVLLESAPVADLTSWSQELRLTSLSDGALRWAVGAMYAEDDNDASRISSAADNVLIFQTVVFRDFTQKVESWALYGQVEYQLTDSVKAHGSLRYTDEQKTMNDYNAIDIFDPSNVFYYLQNVNKSYDLDNNWSGHIGLDWDVGDDAMLYGRITKGFKSGGFFGGFGFSEESLDPYDEEIAYSYEVGFKSQWLDSTLQVNGALYYYDYQDVQGFTQVFSDITGSVITKLGNLGDAEHKGAELDVVWVPLEGLSLQGSINWLDAEIVDSETIGLDQASTSIPIEGLSRTLAPEWSTSLQARYVWSIGSSFVGSAQLNYTWRDDLQNEDSTLSALDMAAFSRDSYQTLSARFSIGGADERWDIALVGRNLTGEEYWVTTSTDDLGSYPSTPSRPMSYGIEANYRW